jgi:hypothetical protein
MLQSLLSEQDVILASPICSVNLTDVPSGIPQVRVNNEVSYLPNVLHHPVESSPQPKGFTSMQLTMFQFFFLTILITMFFSFVTSAYLCFLLRDIFSLLTTTILIWSRMELKPPYDDLHSCSVSYPNE